MENILFDSSHQKFEHTSYGYSGDWYGLFLSGNLMICHELFPI